MDRKYINGYPFWFRLYGEGGLFSSHSAEDLASKFVVSCQVNGKDKPVFMFSFFDRYIDFMRFQADIVPENRNFYEVIFGNRKQKLHFDIDINDTAMTLEKTKQLIDGLKEQISMYFGFAPPIAVYSSHSAEKFSFHVIIDKFYVESANDAKLFYEEMIRRDIPFKQYIDREVYKSIQQFRLLGSTKIGKNRFKIPEPGTSDDFTVSLITYVEESNPVPFKLAAPEKISETNFPERHIDDKSFNDAFAAIHKIYPKTFKLLNMKGSMVLLKRLKPSFCKICDRIHESENAFLFFSKMGCFLNCRRNPLSISLLTDSIVEESIPDPRELIRHFEVERANNEIIRKENTSGAALDLMRDAGF